MFGFKKKNKKTEPEFSESDELVVETMSSQLGKKGTFAPFKAKQKGRGLFSFSNEVNKSSKEENLPKKESEEEVTTKLVNSNFSFGDDDLITSITPKKEIVEMPSKEKEAQQPQENFQTQKKSERVPEIKMVKTLPSDWNTRSNQALRPTSSRIETPNNIKKKEAPIKKLTAPAFSTLPHINPVWRKGKKATEPILSKPKINEEIKDKHYFATTNIQKKEAQNDKIETTLKKIEKLEHLGALNRSNQNTEILPSKKKPVFEQKAKKDEFLGKLRIEKFATEGKKPLIEKQNLRIKPSFTNNVIASGKTEPPTQNKTKIDWVKALGIDLDISIPEEFDKTPALSGLFKKISPFSEKQTAKKSATEESELEKPLLVATPEKEKLKNPIISREETLEIISKQKRGDRLKIPLRRNLQPEEGPVLSRQNPFSKLYSNLENKVFQKVPSLQEKASEKTFKSADLTQSFPKKEEFAKLSTSTPKPSSFIEEKSNQIEKVNVPDNSNSKSEAIDMKSSIQRIQELNPSYKEDNLELRPTTKDSMRLSLLSSFHRKNQGKRNDSSSNKTIEKPQLQEIESTVAIRKNVLENSSNQKITVREEKEAQKDIREPEEKDIKEITNRLKKLTEPEKPERTALLKKLLNRSTEITEQTGSEKNITTPIKTNLFPPAKTNIVQQREATQKIPTTRSIPAPLQTKKPTSFYPTTKLEQPSKNIQHSISSTPPILESVVESQAEKTEGNLATENTLEKINHLEKALKRKKGLETNDLEDRAIKIPLVKKTIEETIEEQPEQETENQNSAGPFFEKNEKSKRASFPLKEKDQQISSLSTRLDKYKHTVDERKRIGKLREQSREEKIKAIVVEQENRINMPLLAIAIVVMILTAGSGYYYYKYTIKKEPIKNLPFIPDIEIETPLSDIMPQQIERTTGPNTTLEEATVEQFDSANLQDSIKKYIASIKENPRMAVELRNGYFIEPHDQNNNKIKATAMLSSFGVDLKEVAPLLEDSLYFFIIRNQKKQPSDPIIVKLNLLIKTKSASTEDDLIREIKSLEPILPTELLPLFIDEDKPSVSSTIEFKSLFTKSRASSEIRYFNYVPKNSTQAIEWGIIKINGLRYLAISTSKRSTDVMILNFE